MMNKERIDYFAEKMTHFFLTRPLGGSMEPPTKEELNRFDAQFQEKKEQQVKLIEFVLTNQDQPFTVETLHGLHKIARGGGAFKEHPNYIGTVVGEKVEEKASPQDVPALIDELIIHVNDILASDLSVESVVREIAKAHINFEQIHPYSDGNGVVGRALIFYLSVKRGMTPFVLEKEQHHECNRLIHERNDERLGSLLMKNYQAEKEKE